MAKYSYRMHYQDRSGEWIPGVGEVGLEYGRGIVDEYRQRPGPSLAARLVRSDGRVMEEVPARTEVSAGLMPSACGHQWPMLSAAGLRSLRRAVNDAKIARASEEASTFVVLMEPAIEAIDTALNEMYRARRVNAGDSDP